VFCHYYYRNESARKNNYWNDYLHIIEHGSIVVVSFTTRAMEGDTLPMGMYDLFFWITKMICVFVKLRNILAGGIDVSPVYICSVVSLE
jgi:hypothetical protein